MSERVKVSLTGWRLEGSEVRKVAEIRLYWAIWTAVKILGLTLSEMGSP